MNLTNNEKHYNTLNNYYKTKYGKKVVKVSLNMNFTCPNKDGKKGYGGCIYCSHLGSGDFAGNKEKTIEEQFKEIKEIMNKKWPDSYYIPYFQANTNTYAPLEKLIPLFEKAIILDKNVKEIAIGTRCDCLEDDKIEYLSSLNKRCHTVIELGLQTSNEKTGLLLNRCHTNLEFEECVKKLKEHNLEVVVHIMNGLPYETKEDMLNTIRFLNKLNIDGIKIHELCILRDTKIYELYKEKTWHLPSLEEYSKIVCDQLEILNPNVIVHRLCADAPLKDLVEPMWTVKKMVVMNEIDKEMRKRGSFQGDLYNPNI